MFTIGKSIDGAVMRWGMGTGFLGFLFGVIKML